MSKNEITTASEVTSVSFASPQELIAKALESGADLNALERLLAIQEKYQALQARNAFNQAISNAKSEIGPIFKRQTATGGAKFQYESLDDVERHVVPVLSRHGLSYRFRTESNADGVRVTCVLAHVAGHWEENSLQHAHDKGSGRNEIQSLGSAQTYLQRYSLKAALGLSASKDDDGAAAGKLEEDGAKIADWMECLRECTTLEELASYFKSIWPDVKAMPQSVRGAVVAVKDQAKKALLNKDETND